MRTRRLALIGTLMALVGCRALASASPSLPPGTIPFEVTGTWERCHPMGACKYTIEISTPVGSSTVELVRLNGVGDAGQLVAEAGLPATLAPGPHDVTVRSTMYGDTIEPNGDQTALGEEARCTTSFAVAPGETSVHVAVALVPQQCTVTVSMDTAP